MVFTQKNPAKAPRISIHTMTKVSILSVISVLIMLLEFPLPFAPSFYKLDLSEAVVLMGGFAMGPLAAVAIEMMKILLNLLLNGSITAGVGELANFLIGCALVVPATWIYRRRKSLGSALLGLVVGTLSLCLAAALLNAFLLLPAYSFFMHMPMDAFIQMGAALNPRINGLLTFVLLAVVPFNLVKGVAVSILAVLLYKKVSPVLHK